MTTAITAQRIEAMQNGEEIKIDESLTLTRRDLKNGKVNFVLTTKWGGSAQFRSCKAAAVDIAKLVLLNATK